jgi:hypothetical protein
MLLVEPLEQAANLLRSSEPLTRTARVEAAEAIQLVLARLYELRPPSGGA